MSSPQDVEAAILAVYPAFDVTIIALELELNEAARLVKTVFHDTHIPNMVKEFRDMKSEESDANIPAIAKSIVAIKEALPEVAHSDDRGFRYNWVCDNGEEFVKYQAADPSKVLRFWVRPYKQVLCVYYETDNGPDPIVGAIIG